MISLWRVSEDDGKVRGKGKGEGRRGGGGGGGGGRVDIKYTCGHEIPSGDI